MENLELEKTSKPGSERSFGITFAVFFAVVSVARLLRGGEFRGWAIVLSAVFLGAAFAFPRALKELNYLWFLFGRLLHKITGPILMTVLFYLVLTPFSWAMRLFRRDPLGVRFDSSLKSYWIERSPPGPLPESLKHQF